MAVSSKQKREVFKREFGAKLTPDGFVFKDNLFVRAHEEVLLVVEMQLTPSGGLYICYDAIPFCEGIRQKVENLSQRVDAFALKLGDATLSAKGMLSAPFEERFDLQYRNFFGKIYGHFGEIKDVRGLLSFQEWQDSILGERGRQGRIMLVCIQLRLFEKAREYASRILEMHEATRRSHLEAMEYNIKYARNESEEKRYRETFGVLLESVAEEIDSIRKRIAWMDEGRYEPLEEEIAQNIHASAEVCRALYPEFYA